MVSIEGNIQQERYWPRWRFVMIGLNLLALALTIILSWHYLQGGSMIGCSGGSPCEQVLSSRWSTIGGILPVSSLAAGMYLAMLVSIFFIGRDKELQQQRLAWNVLVILAGAITGSAIWFFIVQKWFIGSFCPYCITLHIIGVVLTALIIRRAVINSHSSNRQAKNAAKLQSMSSVTKSNILPLRINGLILIGLLTSGILAAGQMAITPKATYSSGTSQNNLTDIDYNTAPIIGAPDAPYVVKVLFDYQCPHCQKLHFMLNEAVRRYAGKLSFVLCPTPLNTQCNPYIPKDVDAFKNSCELARIGLKVWAARREVFPEFESWMFTFESGDKWSPRSLEAASEKAVELIGKEKFDNSRISDWVEQYMQACIQIFGQTLQGEKSGIPKLVHGSQWVTPQPDSEEELLKILQKSLGLPKP
jgi:uncharacterized membrane protein